MALQDTNSKYTNVAVIFGATGLVGRELARTLLSTGDWKVYGVARRPGEEEGKLRECPGYRFVSCDLLSANEAQEKLSSMEGVTHVFWLTWASRFPVDTVKCYEDNKAMMGNVLDAILPKAKGLKHFSLQTGVKHYVSLKGDSDNEKVGLYEESSPRADVGCNFYYALEDLLRERLPSRKIAWSIHRPGLLIGCSRRTFYNFTGSICVYGTICKYLNLPFVFGGTKRCWEEMHLDGSDARLVAEQHVWAANREDRNSNAGEAFNAVNGEEYTWKEMWAVIGAKFGVEGEKCTFSEEVVISRAMDGKQEVWKEIVEKEGLVETKMEELANWEMLDVLFWAPKKMLVSRKKGESMGFKTRYHMLDSILYWIDVMRAEKYIP